ncbi:MAG: hypothetical protein GY746_01520 [Gammaproteobacteria bacterium]|nr:hypothetical protein [Gammaproteobacteria bacterium]
MKNFKSLTLCFVFALLTLGSVGDATADNILINSDFETGDLTGWEVFGLNANATVTVESPDNGPALPGMYNAFMSNHSEASGLTLKQTTPAGGAVGGLISYSFDLKLDQADLGGVLFVEIFAEASGIGIVGGSGLMGPFWPWGNWNTYSGTFNAPANTDFYTVQIMANTGANIDTNCVAHVDNVILDVPGVVSSEISSMGAVKALFR